ncbi:MAG: iron-containing alcohol dehydrogenase [Firmicutes bacterium]|nr:iron-containing alcohol dehydrogenase [Bacillota bacterium]
MQSLKDLKADRLFGEHSCNCGHKHQVKTKIVLSENALLQLPEIISQILPIGNILYITAEDLEKKSKEIERVLFKTHVLNIHRLPANCRPSIETVAKFLENSEGCRLIVGFGSGRVSGAAKYLGFIKDLPVVLITSAPSSLSYLTDISKFYNSGLPKYYVSKFPDVLIADLALMQDCPKNLIADGFGKVLGCLVSLIDFKAAAVLQDSFICENVLELVRDSIEKVFSIREKLSCASLYNLEILMESIVKISLFKQFCGSNLYGAQNDVADILELIDKEKKLSGELIFLAFLKILKLYDMFLTSNLTPLLMPPDYIKRFKMLRELGCSLLENFQELNKNTGADRELGIHKLNEYRAELINEVESAKSLGDLSIASYRRVYSDKGYSIQNYGNSSDFKTAVFLSPVINKGFTLLSFMAELGYFENIKIK